MKNFELEREIQRILDDVYCISERVNNLPNRRLQIAIQNQIIQYLNDKWEKCFTIGELEQMGIIHPKSI